MKARRIFGALALGAVATLGLTSCGGGNDTSKTIEFRTTAGDKLMPTLEKAKKQFEEANPGWTVYLHNGFGYDTLKENITAGLIANDQPSLAVCYPDHVAAYKKSRKVLDMDQFIDKNADYWKDMVQSYLPETTSVDNKRYMLPFSKSTEVLYYNADVITPELLESLNIDLTDYTWDDLWRLCSHLKAEYPKSTPLGYDSDSNWAITLLEEYGARDGAKYYTDGSKDGDQKILFENDVFKNALKDIRAKKDAGLFTTKRIYNNAYTSKLFCKYTKTTKDNKANYDGSFMSIGSSAGASNQESDQFRTNVAVGPQLVKGDAKTLKMISQGPDLVMFDQGSEEKAKMTFKFVEVLLSPAIQAEYAAVSGYLPVVNAAYELLPATNSLANRTIKFTKDISSALFTSDAFVGSSTARDTIGLAFNNVMKTDITATNTLDAIINSAVRNAARESKEAC